jgi:hypothetical protein
MAANRSTGSRVSQYVRSCPSSASVPIDQAVRSIRHVSMSRDMCPLLP